MQQVMIEQDTPNQWDDNRLENDSEA